MLFGLFLVYKNVFYNLLIIIFLFQADADGKRQLFILLQTTEKLLFNPYKYPKICPFKTQKVKIGWKKSNQNALTKYPNLRDKTTIFQILTCILPVTLNEFGMKKNIQGFL